MPSHTPEKVMRRVIDRCADCDSCHVLMDESCRMFPELYRLVDREKSSGIAIPSNEIRRLIELCNFCALCPCPNIREDILIAKTLYRNATGVGWQTRIIEDVAAIGRIGGMLPNVTNALLKGRKTGQWVKALMGIHPDRLFPELPPRHFLSWAKKKHLHHRTEKSNQRKIAYFAGCTAAYLFPEVAEAAVAVLQTSGADVLCPELKCCGMPTYLEGDREKTLRFVRFNLTRLNQLVAEGYDIVCSCPTCGYVFKQVIKRGAYYADKYQEFVGAPPGMIKIPEKSFDGSRKITGYKQLSRRLYGKILKDDGYFSGIDALKRIRVAENTYDLGEYLARYLNTNAFQTVSPAPAIRSVYYPPCHLREQNIGIPYVTILKGIPQLHIESVDWSLYCCGMAGIMGFKKEFHQHSLRLGKALFNRIASCRPDMVITDCLSCRLQFQQQLALPVFHPIQLLRDHFCEA